MASSEGVVLKRESRFSRFLNESLENRDNQTVDDALKQYLTGLKGEIIDTLSERIRVARTEILDTLTEPMREMHREILRGFEPFQKQTSAREAAMEARIGAAEQRLAVVQDRLVEIEKKLLLNPPAA